jgi:hypothetical protein
VGATPTWSERVERLKEARAEAEEAKHGILDDVEPGRILPKMGTQA